jgi:hypothetical protein
VYLKYACKLKISVFLVIRALGIDSPIVDTEEIEIGKIYYCPVVAKQIRISISR